ncbi:MAG: DUF6573 family protein [Pseudomonas fluorescens]
MSEDSWFGPIIHSYSRADAINDGVLIPVPDDVRREAGFGIPTALTAAAWAECVAWDDSTEEATGQSETGRLWDVLVAARFAAERMKDESRIDFFVYRIPCGGSKPARVALVAEVGPGDTAEPVLTIMEPDED